MSVTGLVTINMPSNFRPIHKIKVTAGHAVTYHTLHVIWHVMLMSACVFTSILIPTGSDQEDSEVTDKEAQEALARLR